MLKSIFPLSVATFLCRISGFIRDFLLYSTFGASAILDIFLIAFRLPNLTRRFFAEGSFNQALLPELANLDGANKKEDFRKLYHQGFLFLTLAMGLFTLSAVLAPSLWIGILAPGEHVARSTLLDVVRWTAPYALFVSLVSFYSLMMQLKNKYLLNGFSPILVNIGIIIALYMAVDDESRVLFLGKAVFFAGLLQLTLQYLAGRKDAPIFLSELRFSRKFWPIIKSFIKLSIIGLLIQGNMIIDQLFLSFLYPGAISEYYLCERIVELPIGVIVYSLSVVFATFYSKNYLQKIKKIQLENKALLLIYYLVIPSVIGCFFMAPNLIDLFLNDPISIERTASLLKVFSLCIMPIGLNKIYVIICTVSGRQNTIIKVHLLGSILNIVADYALYRFGTIGIATSTFLTLLLQLYLFSRVIKITHRMVKLPKRIFIPGAIGFFVIFSLSMIFNYVGFITQSKFYYFIVLISVVGMIASTYLAVVFRTIKYLASRV